jgi:hypothetical protein
MSSLTSARLMAWQPPMALEVVKSHLMAALPVPEETEKGIRVTTHCMYPSNGLVRVYVNSGKETAIVSDEGEAVGEVLAAGIEVTDITKVARNLIADQGLLMRGGIIHTPKMPIEAIPFAVPLVANAAKEVAQWFYDHKKIKRARDFRKMLADFLNAAFREQVVRDDKIVGASNKPHKFANVVRFANGRKLIVDAVARDPSSINSRIVANLDIRTIANPLIEQRIVYDDADSWSAADLNLLNVGATVVPFSKAEHVIARVAREVEAA